MAESTVEMALTEIKVLLGNVILFESKLKDISSKVTAGFEGIDYFDFDYKKLGANYYSLCIDIENLREVVQEMRSMLKAAMKGSETNDKGKN